MDNKETYEHFVQKSLRDLLDLTVSTYELSQYDFMKNQDIYALFIEAYKNDLPVGQLALSKFGREVDVVNRSAASSIEKTTQIEDLGKKFTEELIEKAK